MDHHIMWQPWTEPGLEHLHLRQQQEQIVADGLIIGLHEQKPFRARYDIHCTPQWKIRVVHVYLLDDVQASLTLLTDGEGHWTTEHGETLPSLTGCLDVDISATPFTNTLPLQRLALAVGDATVLNMVYIALPQMSVHVVQQRYARLESGPSGEQYRFESLRDGASTFTADLPVDDNKLVLDYPHLFRRVGSWDA